MLRGGAAGRLVASHWRTRPFLSLPGPAPPPSTAHRPGAAGVDGSRRMLMRGRPPQPIGRPRSVGEVSAESQKNRAGPTAECSASWAGRAQPAQQALCSFSYIDHISLKFMRPAHFPDDYSFFIILLWGTRVRKWPCFLLHKDKQIIHTVSV